MIPLTETRAARWQRLAIEKFTEAQENQDKIKCRQMYRELYEVATTAESALLAHTDRRKANAPIRKEDDLPDACFRVYAVTSGGKLWKGGHPVPKRDADGKVMRNAHGDVIYRINHTGWYPMDQSGNVIGPPIGHMAFRKKPLAKRTDHWIRLCRPDGPWRRHIDCILTHLLYGSGRVLATDGVHALFEHTTLEGDKRQTEVAFQSLSESYIPTVRKLKSVDSVNRTKEPKKLSSLLLDLLD